MENTKHVFVDPPFLPENKREATLFLGDIIQGRRCSYILPAEIGADFILDHGNAEYLAIISKRAKEVASELLYKLNWKQVLNKKA
jgi:hypothetical protein